MVKERPHVKLEDVILVDCLYPAIIYTSIFNLAQKHLSENPSTLVPNRHTFKNSLTDVGSVVNVVENK